MLTRPNNDTNSVSNGRWQSLEDGIRSQCNRTCWWQLAAELNTLVPALMRSKSHSSKAQADLSNTQVWTDTVTW